MPSNVFQSLQKPNPMLQQFGQFQHNPLQFLMSRNIQIPQEFQNDPHGAVQYLLNSGRMTQDQFNRLSQMAQKMGIQLN